MRRAAPGRRAFLWRTGVAVAVGASLLSACTSSESPDNPAGVLITGEDPNSAWNGTAITPPFVEPSLMFTDTSGKAFDLAADTTADATLVFFGYTHCPDVCNTVLSELSTTLRRSDAALRDGTEVVFVTTDPDRDTPEVIREYLDTFDESFVGLTAEMSTIEDAADSLGIALTGNHPVGDGYEVGHGSQVLGFGPDGTAPVLWMPGTPIADLREDIAQLITWESKSTAESSGSSGADGS